MTKSMKGIGVTKRLSKMLTRHMMLLWPLPEPSKVHLKLNLGLIRLKIS